MQNEIKNSPWLFWFLVVATLCIVGMVNLADFSLSAPGLLKASGGLSMLDMRLWYTPADVYRLFDALGSWGRANNRLFYLTIDIIIPLSYSLLLWSAISHGAFYRFRAFGLFGGVFDYLENATILILLASYPIHRDSLVIAAACFTMLKFVFCILGFGFAVVGYLMKILRRRAPDGPKVEKMAD